LPAIAIGRRRLKARCAEFWKDAVMTVNPPRFRVDDYVYFSISKDTRYKEAPTDRFVVVAVMPRDSAGIHQYRIQPTGSGPSRLATELELRR
jgi:hypothetical protein